MDSLSSYQNDEIYVNLKSKKSKNSIKRQEQILDVN